MQTIISLLTETINALEERHYVTAGMLAGAAYVMGLRKSNSGTLINILYEIDHLCQYGNFYDASILAAKTRSELESLI